MGSLDSGFPNNHFPVGKENLYDFYYYDLGTAFLKTPRGVMNFASPADTGKGEIRYYETSITGYSYAHFDLLAIQVDEARGRRVTTLDEDLVSNPPSHDASYRKVPEPGTLSLLGIGLIGLAGLGRRRPRT